MRRPQHHAKPAMTRAQGAAQMHERLYGCRDEVFAALTAADLVRTCNVTEKTAQEALDKARSVRGALV